MRPQRFGADPRIGPLPENARDAWPPHTLEVVGVAVGVPLAGIALFAAVWWLLGTLLG